MHQLVLMNKWKNYDFRHWSLKNLFLESFFIGLLSNWELFFDHWKPIFQQQIQIAIISFFLHWDLIPCPCCHVERKQILYSLGHDAH